MNSSSVIEKPKPRNSNIELLRIIAMLMIIAHHIAIHSGFFFPTETVPINRLWVQWIQLGGKIGVNIFVFITGYFSITSGKFKTNKLVNLWLQVFTYSCVIFLLFACFSTESLQLEALLKGFFPITFSTWWFASAYFVLYLLTPFLNQYLNSITKREYQRLLLLFMVLWCIIPTFLFNDWQGNDLLWFVFLYACAGYLRMHFNIETFKRSTYFIWCFLLTALTYCSAVVLDFLGTKFSVLAKGATIFYDMQRLPVFLISITLFLGFSKINIGNISSINFISSTTFGIYLIHDNGFIRPLLWDTLFHNTAHQTSLFLIPYTIAEIFIVFLVCSAIELFRIHCIEKLYAKAVSRFSIRMETTVKRILSSKVLQKL